MTDRWCPSCEEWTSLTDRAVCAWCDTPLERRRRGGWKRPDLRGSKYSDAQLRALHLVYDRDGVSINQLAKRTYGKVGYKSHHSAAVAISAAWKRMGLPARGRIDAVKLACTTHGLAPKHGPRPGYGTYKRRQHRPDQPRCAALKTQPPRKGTRCTRPAMVGAEFCFAHDPQRTLELQANVARMRKRRPRVEMLPMGPFAAWVVDLAAREGSLRRAAERYGWPVTAAYRYAKGQDTQGNPKATIARRTVEAWCDAAGATVDAIYREEVAA